MKYWITRCILFGVISMVTMEYCKSFTPLLMIIGSSIALAVVCNFEGYEEGYEEAKKLFKK